MSGVEHKKVGWDWEKDSPVTQVTVAGDYIWLAGQTPVDSNGDLVGAGDLETQVRATFLNIQEILESFGSGMQDIVHLTTYFTDPLDEALAQRYWKVRREFFGDKVPSSTGVQVVSLIKDDYKVEIEAVAYAPNAGGQAH